MNMAKRMRLEPSSLEGIQKVLNIQELILTPEAKRLQELDNEMEMILKDKSLGIAAKIQKFEEKLAEFRQVQDKIIEQGTTTIVDRQKEERGREDMRAMLRSVLEDLLPRHGEPDTGVSASSDMQSSSLTSSASGDLQGASGDTTTSTVQAKDLTPPRPLATSTAMKRSSSDANLLQQSPPSAIFDQSAYADNSQGSLPGVHSSLTKTDEEVIAAKIRDVLKAAGMKEENGRYLFPISDVKMRSKLRKNHIAYVESTYNKVVKYMLSKTAQPTPHKSEQLLSIIRDSLKHGLPEYAEISKIYPNLVSPGGTPPVNFGKWSKLS